MDRWRICHVNSPLIETVGGVVLCKEHYSRVQELPESNLPNEVSIESEHCGDQTTDKAALLLQ
jgi:hypothetical protein